MGASTDRGRKREEHNEVRWPHLPVQRPPAATRSPPPLRRRCTLLLLLLVGVVAVVWSMAGVEALLPRQGELEPAMACRPRRRSLAGRAWGSSRSASGRGGARGCGGLAGRVKADRAGGRGVPRRQRRRARELDPFVAPVPSVPIATVKGKERREG